MPYIMRHKIKLTAKGSGVEVLWTETGEKRFAINCTLPEEKDTEAQDRIISNAGRPVPYRNGLSAGGCR